MTSPIHCGPLISPKGLSGEDSGHTLDPLKTLVNYRFLRRSDLTHSLLGGRPPHASVSSINAQQMEQWFVN